MRTKLSIAFILALSLLVSACASRTVETQAGADGADGTTGSGADGTGSDSNTLGGSSIDSASISGSGSAIDPLTQRTVYFEYDSSTLSDEARLIIEAHAAYISDNPGLNVSLAGHADERGSREYNLALGERRSKSVEQLMNGLGVDGARMQVVSFGEEAPAVEGSNEAAWSQNRRVEIEYQ